MARIEGPWSKSSKYVVCCAVVLFLPGCDPSAYGTGASSSSGALVTGATCPDAGTTLTYSSFGQSFMASSCTECHGTSRSAGGVRLDTQSAVQSQASLVDSVAGSGPNGTRTQMPQGSSVSTSEREKLSEWLACGAP